MENNLVRTAELLGSKKNIVGGTNADLILETLGKIYIKSGNRTRLLDDVFKLLDLIGQEGNTSKIIITDSLKDETYPGDGYLMYDYKLNSLYLSYDRRYLLIIDKLDPTKSNEMFVKKSGDIMTGLLRIVHSGAPLIVASKELVKNFNANYLEGHDSEYFTSKELDELIYGTWTFDNNTTFKLNTIVEKNSLVYGNLEIGKNLLVSGNSEFYGNSKFHNNVRVDGDVVLEGSIGSPEFMSGYNGYGWRFDANTNMLTVDYLVVRKAMHVFELVVNLISATNGSLWVTDSGEIDLVYDVHLLKIDDLLNLLEIEEGWYIPYNDTYNYKLLEIPLNNIGSSKEGSLYFHTFRYLCKFESKDILETLLTEEPISFSYMQKVGILFGNSDSINPTHFYNETLGDFLESTELNIPTHIKVGEEYLTLEQYVVKYANVDDNKMFNTDTTARMFVVDKNNTTYSSIDTIYLYYKYFGNKELNVDNIKVIKMKDDKIPPFKEGDLVRCQKFLDGDIKYYDALILNKIAAYEYVIVTAESVFDKQTTVKYNEDGSIAEYTEELNKSLYEKTPQSSGKSTYGESEVNNENFDENTLIAGVAKGDGIVRIGHLYDKDRLNSVYITSSELNSPYIQTISGVCRPDYTVLCGEPEFITNDRGLYLFNVNYLEGSYIKVESLKGYDYCKVVKDEKENTVFYYKNNYCIIDKNPIVANLNENKRVKINNNVRTRLGNLDGIIDPMFEDTQPYGYGLFADNVFLKGEFYLNNGNSVVEFTKDYVNLQFSKDKPLLKLVFPLIDYASLDDLQSIWYFKNLASDRQFGKDSETGELSFSGRTTTLNSTIYRKSNTKFYNWEKLTINVAISVCTVEEPYLVLAYGDDENNLTELETRYKLVAEDGSLIKDFTIDFSPEDLASLKGKYMYLGFVITSGFGTIKFKDDIGTATFQLANVLSLLVIDQDGIKLTVLDEITGLMSQIEQTVNNIEASVETVNGLITLLELLLDAISMSVGKTYLFTPTILESQLDDCILLWNGETKRIETLEDGTKTAYIHNTSSFAGFYKKSLSKVTLKTNNTLLFEVNVYNTGVYFVLLNSNNQVISDAVYYDESNKFMSCAATATGSGNNISFDFTTSEATAFPGYFTIKLDISDDYVYLYCVSSTNSIYFYNDRVLLDLGAVFNMTKDAISMDLESAGIYLGEGHPDPKYNGANIVLTGANTYIDSTVTIGTNELIAKDDDENSLVINKEASVDFSKVRCIDWTKLNQEVELSTSSWSMDSNISPYLYTGHIDDKYLLGYHKGLFSLVKKLSVLYFLGASQVLINGLWYNISALKYAPNHFGFTSGPNYYISNGYRGVNLYRADYVRCYGFVYDGITYEGDLPCLLLINRGVDIQYGMATGSVDSSLYALVNGSYVKANYFVPYAIYSSDGQNYLLGDPNYKPYPDEDIVTILYTSIGSVATISETFSITGYKDNNGNQYSLTTFEPMGSIVAFFYTFKGADNTTLFAKSPKVSDTLGTQLKIYKHGWLSEKPTHIDLVLSLQTNPTTTVSINTDSNATYYYACMVQDMGGQIEESNTYTTEVLFLRTLTEGIPSTSGITPQGFTFVSPNKKYFISFSDGAFKVGSTSAWVTISDKGILQTKSKFEVDNVTDKVFCNTSIKDEEISIHDFS